MPVTNDHAQKASYQKEICFNEWRGIKNIFFSKFLLLKSCTFLKCSKIGMAYIKRCDAYFWLKY